LNNQIKKIVTLTPEVEEMVRIRNRKIEEAIWEVEEAIIMHSISRRHFYQTNCISENALLTALYFSNLGHSKR